MTSIQVSRPSTFLKPPVYIAVGGPSEKIRWQDLMLFQQEMIYEIGERENVRLEEIRDAVRSISNDGVEERLDALGVLAAETNLSLTQILEELELQTGLMRKMLGHLRSIDAAVNNPLATQNKERFSRGADLRRRSLFEAALRDQMAVLRADETNPMAHLEIARIRMWGRNKRENLIDLNASDIYYSKALVYIEAYRDKIPETILDTTLYERASLYFIRAGESVRDGDPETAKKYLNKAVGDLFRISDAHAKVCYLAAQCFAALGKRDKVLVVLRKLIDDNRLYAVMAQNDPNFAELKADIAAIPADLLQNPGPKSKSVYVLVDVLGSLQTDLGAVAAAKRINTFQKRPHDFLPSIRETSERARRIEADFLFGKIDSSAAVDQLTRLREEYLANLRIKISEMNRAIENERVAGQQKGISGWVLLVILFYIGLPAITGMGWLWDQRKFGQVGQWLPITIGVVITLCFALIFWLYKRGVGRDNVRLDEKQRVEAQRLKDLLDRAEQAVS